MKSAIREHGDDLVACIPRTAGVTIGECGVAGADGVVHDRECLGHTEIVVEYKRESQRSGTEPTNPVSEVDRNVEAMIAEDEDEQRMPEPVPEWEEAEAEGGGVFAKGGDS